jgi:hypothetical protein
MAADQNGFFQARGQAANFEYWAKQPTWAFREAAALFIGLNPEWAITKEGAIYRDADRYRRELAALIDMVYRAVSILEVHRSARPSQWIEWAKSRGVPHPPELASLVAQWNQAVDPRDEEIQQLRKELGDLQAKLSASDKPVSTRQRESMLKLILGMAIGGYRYDPAARRNESVSEIAGDLAECGLPLNVDTVREYLQEATQHLEKYSR